MIYKSIFSLALIFATTSCTTDQVNQAMKSLPGVINAVSGESSGGLSELDVAGGLKSALSVGASNASKSLNVTNAFFKNQLIKIAFPPEALKMKQTLEKSGLSSLVDKFELSLNRAAEDAAIKAKPIFVSAITSMTISDAMSILYGKPDSATSYLKSATSSQLASAFKPVIASSLNKVDATRYWTDIMSTYNQIPFVKKMNPDLTNYVTAKALTGMFVVVSEEEQKIRKNPAARVTSILKKVFGYKDANPK